MDDNGQLSIDPNGIVEILNKHFESVFDKTQGNPKELPNLRTKEKLADIKITEARVQNLLESLDPNKTPGCDRVHSRILKECALEWT